MQDGLRAIKLLALDVDGVLTDGSLCIGAEGETYKVFNAKDGMGISCALRCGLKVALITGRSSMIVKRRAEELGITILLQNVKDKNVALKTLSEKLRLMRCEIAYMGDDLNDLPAFACAGTTFAPADAAAEIKAAADTVTVATGGRGAVREVIESILKAQSQWQRLVAEYSACGCGDKQ